MVTQTTSSEVASSSHTQQRDRERRNKGEVWWSNGIFFVSLHVLAIVGALYLSPVSQLNSKTAILCFISWQLASFGITIGYHRLWSHKAFTATLPLRITLAWMGSMGFQGSIKWWVLRHRLHHRFTDSPTHDPYAATNGLWYSHCGWIFRKPSYPRMKMIERGDLESDPVVRFQHRNYLPIALFSGLILPWLIAHFGWNDGLGGLVWGGAIARLLIWHTTFCINSLAHWTGLQPYTEEVSARGNYLLALLTSGEGNHNFHHAFPFVQQYCQAKEYEGADRSRKDFRNGPHPADWDPTKWIIYILHKYTSLVPQIARTPESAVVKARARVHMAEADRLFGSVKADEMVKSIEDLPVWTRGEVLKRHGEWVREGEEKRRRILVLLEGCLVDVGGYLEDHPGGDTLLLSHCVAPLSTSISSSDSGSSSGSESESDSSSTIIDSGYASSASSPTSTTSPTFGSTPSTSSSTSTSRARTKTKLAEAECRARSAMVDVAGDADAELHVKLRDATRSFFGGMNNHSSAAREMMRCLRVAKLDTGLDPMTTSHGHGYRDEGRAQQDGS